MLLNPIYSFLEQLLDCRMKDFCVFINEVDPARSKSQKFCIIYLFYYEMYKLLI